MIYNFIKIKSFFKINEGNFERKLGYRIFCNKKILKIGLHNYKDEYIEINKDLDSMFYIDNLKIIFCVHALTRNGSDYEFFSRYIANLDSEYLIICPDLPGRDISQGLPYDELYNYNNHAKDLIMLIKYLNIKELIWIGTSMGGILGMIINKEMPDLIKKIILNDVGPESVQTTRLQIYDFIYKTYKEYNSYEEISRITKASFAFFGIKSNEHWDFFIKNSIKLNEKNKYVFNFEMGVLNILKHPFTIDLSSNDLYVDYDKDNWCLVDYIKCPILLIWGKVSSMLTCDMVKKFQSKNKDLSLITVPLVGHAPSFMNDDLIRSVSSFIISDKDFPKETLIEFIN